MRDAAFALVWTAMFPISLWSAHVGVLLWVWVALISPGEQMYGAMAGIPYNKIVAIATIGVVFLNRERKQFYLDTAMVLMILLALAGTVSYSLSIAGDAGNEEIYQKFLKELVLAFVICGVMFTRHRLHMLMIVVCLGYGFFAVSEGGQFLLTAGGHKILGTGSVGDNNSLAAAILMIVPMIYYLFQYAAWKPVKLAFLGMLIFSILCIIGTYSRGGFLGMIVVALMFLKNSRYKIRSALMIAALAGLIVAAAPESWYERLDTLHDTGDDGSFMQRVTVWKISTLIALEHPVFGGGFHAVQTWPVWLKYAGQLPFAEFIKTPPPDPVPRAAHSSYFEILGDMGFTGLGLFLILLFTSIRNCSRTIRLARGRPDLLWAADMARMLQISLVVYVVTTIALSMAYFEALYIVVAIASRLLRTARQTIAGTLPAETGALKFVPSWVRPGLPQPGLARPGMAREVMRPGA